MASQQRRQRTFFLGDTEEFAFEFGGAAAEPLDDAEGSHRDGVVGPHGATAASQQRGQERAEELAASTARMTAAVAQEAGPLSLAQVSSSAEKALEGGARILTSLPLLRRGGDVVGETTMAEAVTTFQDGLRRYDEGLWRADKQRRVEEEERLRRSRQRQRA